MGLFDFFLNQNFLNQKPQSLGKVKYGCKECGKEIYWHERCITGTFWLCPVCDTRDEFYEKTSFAGDILVCDDCSNAYPLDENSEICPYCGGKLIY